MGGRRGAFAGCWETEQLQRACSGKPRKEEKSHDEKERGANLGITRSWRSRKKRRKRRSVHPEKKGTTPERADPRQSRHIRKEEVSG